MRSAFIEIRSIKNLHDAEPLKKRIVQKKHREKSNCAGAKRRKDEALEYGLIDRVDSYQADDKDVQQRLMSRVQQLSGVIAQQKSFREQLESMRQQGGEPKPPVPTPKPEPEEKKLTNQLAKLFQNM